jgi:hypothetical protein
MTRSYTSQVESAKIEFLVGLGKDALGAAKECKAA